jgi:hypothetical protein
MNWQYIGHLSEGSTKETALIRTSDDGKKFPAASRLGDDDSLTVTKKAL